MIWLWVAALGCATRTAPPVFALPVERPEAPEEWTWDSQPEDVGAVVSLLAGEPAPGDGVLMPPARLAALRWQAEVEGAYWREVAAVCYDGRELDRALAEAEAGRRWQYGEDTRAELRVVRAAGSAAFVVGVALGALAVGLVP